MIFNNRCVKVDLNHTAIKDSFTSDLKRLRDDAGAGFRKYIVVEYEYGLDEAYDTLLLVEQGKPGKLRVLARDIPRIFYNTKEVEEYKKRQTVKEMTVDEVSELAGCKVKIVGDK